MLLFFFFRSEFTYNNFTNVLFNEKTHRLTNIIVELVRDFLSLSTVLLLYSSENEERLNYTIDFTHLTVFQK